MPHAVVPAYVLSNVQLLNVAVQNYKLARVALEISFLFRMNAFTNVANIYYSWQI